MKWTLFCGKPNVVAHRTHTFMIKQVQIRQLMLLQIQPEAVGSGSLIGSLRSSQSYWGEWQNLPTSAGPCCGRDQENVVRGRGVMACAAAPWQRLWPVGWRADMSSGAGACVWGGVFVFTGQLCMFCTAVFGVLAPEHFRALSGGKRLFWWGYKSSWCFMTWQTGDQVSQFLQNKVSFPSGQVTTKLWV